MKSTFAVLAAFTLLGKLRAPAPAPAAVPAEA